MKRIFLTFIFLTVALAEISFAQNIFQVEEKRQFQNKLKILMGAPAQKNSREIPSLALFQYLMRPEDRVFTLQSHPELFAFIETQIVKPLCDSPTGRFICQEFHLREMGYSGLSGPMAKSVLNHLILVESHNMLLSVDSFAYFGEAWVFVHPDQISQEHLLRMIAHEMFQLVDIKNLIHVDPRIRELYLTDETDCKALSVLRNEEFRLTTSAIRSFIVEDRIVREILQRPGYGLEKLNCEDRIYKVLAQVQSIPDAFSTFGMSAERLRTRDPENKCLTLTGPVSFEEALRFSKSISVMDSAKSKRVSACEFLVTPSFIGSWSQPIGPKTFMQGPRPGIGEP